MFTKMILTASASALLVIASTTSAWATCSINCKIDLVDDACVVQTAAPGGQLVEWDVAPSPLVTGVCEVQCCAPGMCSPKTFEDLKAETLQLRPLKGKDALKATFSKVANLTCNKRPVFEIDYAFVKGDSYLVGSSGIIGKGFIYQYESKVDPDMGVDTDMGQGGGMDPDPVVDMGGREESDMAQEADMRGGSEVDLGNGGGGGDQDQGTSSGSPDQGGSSEVDMGMATGGGKKDLGGDSEGSGMEEDGCSSVGGSGTGGGMPWVALVVGVLFGWRRRRSVA